MFLLFMSPVFAQNLNATTAVQVTPQGSWMYTLNNNEASTSDNWLTSFYLPINAPVSNVTSPINWTVDTDGASYVLWSDPESYPYPDDVAPGASLSGFSFISQSLGGNVLSTVSSWNHASDNAGPTVDLQVLSPGSAPSVPEASTWQSLGLLILLGVLVTMHTSYCKHAQKKL